MSKEKKPEKPIEPSEPPLPDPEAGNPLPEEEVFDKFGPEGFAGILGI